MSWFYPNELTQLFANAERQGRICIPSRFEFIVRHKKGEISARGELYDDGHMYIEHVESGIWNPNERLSDVVKWEMAKEIIQEWDAFRGGESDQEFNQRNLDAMWADRPTTPG